MTVFSFHRSLLNFYCSFLTREPEHEILVLPIVFLLCCVPRLCVPPGFYSSCHPGRGFSHGEGIFRYRIRVPSYKRACVVDLAPLFLTIMHRPVLSNLMYSDPWNGCIRSYIFCFVLHFEGAGTLQRRKKCGFYPFARCISYSVVTNQD